MSAHEKQQETNKPLSYNEYLKVDQLLQLQQCMSSPPYHDELLFILIHQTYELWFNLILHECDGAINAMNSDDALTAERMLGRVVEIQRILVPQIHVLETMLPKDFLAFRSHLKPASGFQSSQFREFEIISGLKDPRMLKFFEDDDLATQKLMRRLSAPTLGDAFYALMARRGLNVKPQPSREDTEAYQAWCDEVVAALIPVYHNPHQNYEILKLAERLIEIDEYISLWRYHHVRMVERMVGAKTGTGGSEGVGYLQRTLALKSFPELWELRTQI